MRSQHRAGLCRRLTLLLLWCLIAGGCSSSTPVQVGNPPDPTAEKLRKIIVAYGRFCVAEQRPPESVEELKPMLAQLGDPGDLLRSSRDGQPFVVCWGVDLLAPPSWAKSKTPVLAYEKQGVDGQRYILTTQRRVELMPDQDFRQAGFPPGHTPSF